MNWKHYTEADAKDFNGDNVRGVTGRIAIGKAHGAQNFCMRVFELEPDGYTPRHSHEWEHEIFIHRGGGQVYGNGGWNTIVEGTVLFIPGNEEHQIRNTSKEKLVFICLIPSGFPEL